MEALKLLVELVKDLPTMALWVIVGFFIYKISIVGSVYGVIRFVSGKAHDVFVAFANRDRYKEVSIVSYIDDITMRGSADILIRQIKRLPGVSNQNAGLSYIHESDVAWLKEAIDEKLKKEATGN